MRWPQDFFVFEGRLGFAAFWTRMLLVLLFGLPIFLLPALFPRPLANIAWGVTIVLAGWSQASLTWRRLNDHGLRWPRKLLLAVVPIVLIATAALLYDMQAGWAPAFRSTALVLGLICLVVASPFWLIATILLYIRPGTSGTNQFGPDPGTA